MRLFALKRAGSADSWSFPGITGSGRLFLSEDRLSSAAFQSVATGGPFQYPGLCCFGAGSDGPAALWSPGDSPCATRGQNFAFSGSLEFPECRA